MKLAGRNHTKYVLGTFVTLLALNLGGCFGAQQEEEQLETTEENANAEGAEAPTEGASADAEATDGEATAAETSEGEEATADTGAEGAVEEMSETTAAPIGDAVTTGTTGDAVPTAAVAAGGTGGTDPNRVVRFVKVDQAGLFDRAENDAPTVGTLLKGERVLIVEENGWGRITDGMFVKLDALANKAIPRNREPAVWLPPAH